MLALSHEPKVAADVSSAVEGARAAPGKVVRTRVSKVVASVACTAGQDARLYGRPEARHYVLERSRARR
jgi:hypothetical protein